MINFEIEECPECGSDNLEAKEDRGELVCKNCGLVIDEDLVNDSKEWRAFNQEEKEEKSRSGAPLTYTRHDKGISTELGKGKGELFKVSPKKRSQYSRLMKWHNRLTGSKKRNMRSALLSLNRIISSLGLPRSVHEEVGRLYEKSKDHKCIIGRNRDEVIAALVYIVARNQDTPRSMNEISEETGISTRKLGKTYRYVARELDLRIKPADPVNYIPRFAEQLQLSGEVQAKARDIIQKAREEGLLAGRGPTGIASAALYLASNLLGDKRTQKDISNTAGVTQVTVRNISSDFIDSLDVEDPNKDKR